MGSNKARKRGELASCRLRVRDRRSLPFFTLPPNGINMEQ